MELIAPDAAAWLDGENGRIEIGKRCLIHPGSMLLPYDGFNKIGDDCSVNPYTILYGHGGLTIGNGVRIATHTVGTLARIRTSNLAVRGSIPVEVHFER